MSNQKSSYNNVVSLAFHKLVLQHSDNKAKSQWKNLVSGERFENNVLQFKTK